MPSDLVPEGALLQASEAVPATDTISVQPGDHVDVLATLARPNSEPVT